MSTNHSLKNLVSSLVKEILEEQQNVVVGGPDPYDMGKAYYGQDELLGAVVKRMKQLAPQGVMGQGEYKAVLMKALDQVENDLKQKAKDLGQMSDFDLTLAAIQRRMTGLDYRQVLGSVADGGNYQPLVPTPGADE